MKFSRVLASFGPSCEANNHIPGVAAGDHGSYGRFVLEPVGLAGTPSAALEPVPVGGGTVAAGWWEHATEMAKRIAATERFLIGELLVWSGRARAYWLVLGA
jgi:hypothetical protein